jgi:hypothetical protein
MTQTITLDLVEAYSQCPRKAFLMMSGSTKPVTHEYVRITDEQAAANRQVHRARLGQGVESPPCGIADLKTGAKVLADTELVVDGLHARCDFLRRLRRIQKEKRRVRRMIG